MWLDKPKSSSPIQLKQSISKKHTQYVGQNQHDSQEFLSCLLDELHEDLNRVVEKSYIPVPELISIAGDQKEFMVFKFFESCCLLRNQSTINDLFQGFYRCQLYCSLCKHNKVTFDPFLTVQLPLPQ